MLYLAYGSNLNKEHMSRRCPDAVPIGTAYLKGWILVYKGSKTGAYLTIERTGDSRYTPCGVWEISEDDEKALDRYEGYPRFYTKKIIKVLPNGYKEEFIKKVDALVYVMNEGTEYALPSESYIHTCEQGYRDFGFDVGFLGLALRRTRVKIAKETSK